MAGLIVALIVAGLALNSVLNGAVFALWPVMRIVVNALLLYNSAVRSGRFDALRTWVITHLPNDRHVVPMVVGFCFGASLEGIAGLGTPVTITSSLLILVGFPTLEALVFGLIFNPAPVAFAVVTHLGTPLLRARVAARGAPDALHGTRTDADSFRQRYSGGTNLTFESKRISRRTCRMRVLAEYAPDRQIEHRVWRWHLGRLNRRIGAGERDATIGNIRPE